MFGFIAALLVSLGGIPSAAADGRDGGALRGCSSVTDTSGTAVSGRAGAISSGITRECPAAAAPPAPEQPAAQQPSERPVAKAAPKPAAVPVEAPAPVRAPIARGQVSAPGDPEADAVALRGALLRAGATVITGGVLIWFLHSSLWASLLVLGVPVWRHVDLLPIVEQAGDGLLQHAQPAEGAEDFAVARVLDSAAGRGAGA